MIQKLPKRGDTRIVTKFLFLPVIALNLKTDRHERRWLITATILQQYETYMDENWWENKWFID